VNRAPTRDEVVRKMLSWLTLRSSTSSDSTAIAAGRSEEEKKKLREEHYTQHLTPIQGGYHYVLLVSRSGGQGILSKQTDRKAKQK
jgi:hypothetical protein